MSVHLIAALVVAACSSSRDVRPIEGPAPPTSSSVPDTDPNPDQSPGSASTSVADTREADSTPPSAAVPTSSSSPPGTNISGTAVAGSAGPVEAGGPPYGETDAFSEAVRLRDGTCVGWAGSEGGSTDGLAVGARVVILAAEADEQIGSGRIRRSRWEDVSDGGRQWNCFFDFTATVTGSPAEFRVRVAALEPWLARPDPADPDTFVASVNTNAAIGLISSCPALPEPTTSTTEASTTSTTSAPRLVSDWRAVGRYWSQGVAALCRAGLPVTAIARPCRPPGVGSEYIVAVVDSADSTVSYDDGAEVPVGTEVTVVVATGRLCD